MTDTSALVWLSLTNWFHLLATVVWIGGIITNLTVVQPSARESLEPPVMGRFMDSFIRRLRPLIYASMAVLAVSGIIMMLLNRHYLGLFDFGNLWTQFVLVKHILVLVIIILGVYMLGVIFPKMGRLAAKGPSPQLGKLQKLQIRLGMTSVTIALLVLLFTAITGAVSALP